MKIVNDDSSSIIKWSFKLIDTTRGVIYDSHMAIVQATGRNLWLVQQYPEYYVRKDFSSRINWLFTEDLSQNDLQNMYKQRLFTKVFKNANL